MNPLKKLFKQTAIYGLATVLPRLLSFVLVPFHTGVMQTGTYGETSIVFAWLAIFNVVLAYGMETAFFRFFNKNENKQHVVATALISIILSTVLFLVTALLCKESLAGLLDMPERLTTFIILILAMDALVIVPFAWIRAKEKPMRYAIIKVVSVAINLGLNIFLLAILPEWASENTSTLWSSIYKVDFQLEYVFIANVISSAITLIWVSGLYFNVKYTFNIALWKSMFTYAWPIMVAGVAFTINEVFDRILLNNLLPVEMAKSEIGKYSGCYKVAVFMTLFATAFRLGIEPFFFSHAKNENPQKSYAEITTYFVIFGSIILLSVIVFSDILKELLVRNSTYWEAMTIVPFILLANFFLGIYHNLSVWYKVTDKTKYGAYISCIGAVLTLLINFIFIPKIGYMASAIATLVAYGTMMSISYYLGRKHYPIPYNIRKIVFYGGLSILFSGISFYVFDRNLIVGSILLLVFLSLIYKLEGDKLKGIFVKKPL